MNEREERACEVLREHGREDLAETIAAALAEKSQEIKELWERVNRYQQILAENKPAVEYKQRAEAAEAVLESARAAAADERVRELVGVCREVLEMLETEIETAPADRDTDPEREAVKTLKTVLRKHGKE